MEIELTGQFGEVLHVTMSTATSGATIFYRIGNVQFLTPTHSNGSATNGTSVYSVTLHVAPDTLRYFRAVAYKAGMMDSEMSDLEVDNQIGGNAAAPGPRTVTYNNDPLNRMSMTDNGVATNYTPSGINQYKTVTGQTPSYDSNFNLSGYDGRTYVYDADKRLISASGPGAGMAPAQSAQFVYDGLGRCVKRTIGNVTTVITYDEWKPIAEWNGAGGLVAWNLYGPGADEVLVRHQAGTSTYLYYHLDAMGHVVFLLDGNGGVLERYSYDAFGRPKMMDGYGAELTTTAYGNRFLFTGREYLPTLGIYDYRNRVYHPGLGRFLQVDPIGFKGDASNLYRYCGGNPINRSDSMGLDQDDPQEVPHMLTSWGKGDWISGANGLGYNDKQRHFSAGMGGGGGGPGGSGQGGPKPISSKNEGQKAAPVEVRGGTAKEEQKMRQAATRVLKTRKGLEGAKRMKEMERPLIVEINHDNYTYSPKGPEVFKISIDPHFGRPPYKDVYTTSTTAGNIYHTLERQIAHEMGHSVFGLLDDGWNQLNNVREVETPIMLELGQPERLIYD